MEQTITMLKTTHGKPMTRRNPPLFPIDTWNCFQSVLDDEPKTNNACEGFHNAFASALGCAHPNLYKLIDKLKEQEALTTFKINQFQAGTVPPKKRKYQELATKLQDIVAEYGTGKYEPLEYVKRLAYTISE